jgi:hypothetical protein
MKLSQSLERAIQTWQRMGIELLPPADEHKVHAAMEQIGQRASADVIQLYGTTGGFIDYEMDASLWSLWSLERVRQENAATDVPRWAFGDYSISAFHYHFQYENELVSSIWWGAIQNDDAMRIAASVEEFFDLYLVDPTKVCLFY